MALDDAPGKFPLSRTIRVLVVDDHPVMRRGLASSLNQEPDIAIVGEAEDGKAALEAARRLRPDVVLMDLGMPGIDGIEATRRIRAEMPGIRIVGLSVFEEEEQASAMLLAGAAAYLSKCCSIAELTAAIRRSIRSSPDLQTTPRLAPSNPRNRPQSKE
ncbi:MAG: response regulator transcription factor [Acidobacteria bacterium]|nr:response regulator transcription factor [Acidobacteriota bacterium]